MCVEFVNSREQTVQEIIVSNQQGLISETKSSAGDKHETGRAMLQLEMEKASQQLEGIHQMKAVLAKIKIEESSEKVRLGSLIITNQATYFLAISAGELKVLGESYYAISTNSPIGKLLIGKGIGETLTFIKPIEIVEIY
mgnify:CR=1 FL=1